MFTVNTKKSFIIVMLVLVSFASQAFEGVKPKLITNSMELTKVNTNTVQIKTNLFAVGNETYELQRSYDNKNFNTVVVIFADEINEFYKPIKMNDKVNISNKKVYYRIIKVENESAFKLMSKTITTK